MDPYIGQIMQVGFNFEPVGWFICDGRLLFISDYEPLFQVIGNIYGGDQGGGTFRLPDCQGRVSVGVGQLAGGMDYKPGFAFGSEKVTLTQQNLAMHTHVAQFESSGASITLKASTSPGSMATPTAGAMLAQAVDQGGSDTPNIYAPPGTAATVPLGVLGINFGGGSVINSNTGESLPVSVLQPLIAFTTLICYAGIFPTRS